MKYAFMSFSTPELDLSTTLAVAAELGFDGIEPRLDAKHKHGVEVDASAAERDAIRAESERSGIPLVCLATSLRYADPEARREMIKQTHERVDLAGDLNVPVIRVFGGKIPEATEREEAIDLVAECFQAVAEHAAERCVTVCMETHDDWCDPTHVAAVMERVDNPTIAVNWDIMHPVRMGFATIDASFEALRPWIRHLHIHDGTTNDKGLTLVPIGEGDIDHKRALERLTEIEYSGAISGEWIQWEPYDIHLPRELATLKRLEQGIG